MAKLTAIGSVLNDLYDKQGKQMLYTASRFLDERRSEEAVDNLFVQLTKKYADNPEVLRNKTPVFFDVFMKNRAIRMSQGDGPVVFPDGSELFRVSSAVNDKDAFNDFLVAAIRNLNETARQVLEYKYLMECTDAEIADMTGLEVSSVDSIIYRTVKALVEVTMKADEQTDVYDEDKFTQRLILSLYNAGSLDMQKIPSNRETVTKHAFRSRMRLLLDNPERYAANTRRTVFKRKMRNAFGIFIMVTIVSLTCFFIFAAGDKRLSDALDSGIFGYEIVRNVSDWRVTYVPEGYVLMETFDEQGAIEYVYKNINGNFISIYIYKVDTFLAEDIPPDYTSIIINERPAYYYKGDLITTAHHILILDESNNTCISIVADCDMNEALKVAENIKS